MFFYEIVASRPCGARVEWILNCSSLHVLASEVNTVNFGNLLQSANTYLTRNKGVLA